LSWQDWLNYIHHFGINYGMRVIYAVLILIVGWLLAKCFRGALKKTFHKFHTDKTVGRFVSQMVYIIILAFAVIAALSKLGVQTASLVAALGAVVLAISLSLKNSLSNFSAGILLLVNKPFKTGDFVDVAGVSGTIERIHLLLTRLRTSNNQIVSVSNSQVLNSKIVNYSSEKTRRINLTIGIGYEDDITKAKKLLERLVTEDKRILKDPTYLIAVSELADSSVNLLVRVWVNRTDYWPVTYSLNENIKLQFDKNNISMPFPQRDVHLFAEK
jgi:small conductance mechanosensitive channel